VNSETSAEGPPLGDRPSGGGSGGAVRTFLIADVRGFTRFTQEQGDEAASELAARFARIVSDEVPHFEGELLEVRGDEALCVFGSARQALRAAIGLQRRFRERRHDEPLFPLGVGIGLDAGEAVATNGGFRGKALNLAARLCALAAPGEVLATDSVVHLAHRVERISFVTRRAVRLKGVEEPVRVVEVRSDEELPPVPAPPPPPRAARRTRVLVVVLVCAIAILALAGALLFNKSRGSEGAPAFRPGTVLLDLKSGKETGFVPPSQLAQPGFPLFADGHFWLTNFAPSSFVEIDPASGEVLAQFATPSGAQDTQTYTPFAVRGGALWIGAGRDLVKMDTRLGKEVDRFDLDRIVGDAGTVEGVALGGGLVWVGRNVGRGQVVAIDPDTGELRHRFDDVNHHVDLAYDDGRVWTADFGGVNVIDPSTNVVADVRDISATANFVTAGGGFGWTTDPAKGVVYKIDGNGRVVESYRTGLGANGGSFSGGVLWVANEEEGSVTGIDAITGKQITYRFGHPVGIAAAGGGVLLAALNPGRTTEDRIGTLSGNVLRLFSQQGALGDGNEPALNWNTAAFQVDFATCAKLLNYPDESGPAGLVLQPEIAAAMPVLSADRRTYTFTVRDGYRFSPPSSEPVTAETFLQSIERALSPKLGDFQPAAFYVDDIEGEQAFRQGKAAHISGLRADGNHLSITLTGPSPDFLQRLALPFFCPVPLGTPVVPGGANRGRGDNYSMPSAGPYYVADWSNDRYVILKRNPNYPGPRPHALDAIALREAVDPAVALDRIQRESWNGIVSSGHNGSSLFAPLLGPGGPLASRYGGESSSGNQYIPVGVPETGFIALNAARGPFADPALRRGAALAINRSALAAVWDQAPTDQLLPPMFPSFRDRQLYSLTSDLDKAAALTKGRQATAVMAIYSGCDPCSQEAEAVRAQLGQVGIRVRIKEYDDAFGAASKPGTRIDILDSGIQLDYPDSASFLVRMFNDAMPPSWLSPEVRREAGKLARLSGGNRQPVAAAVADRLAADAVPVIAYGNLVQGELLAPSVGCRVYPPFSPGVDLAALCRT
jgi:class 3 adenylate cyclase/ABC-type transport system substrate-binding protein